MWGSRVFHPTPLHDPQVFMLCDSFFPPLSRGRVGRHLGLAFGGQ